MRPKRSLTLQRFLAQLTLPVIAPLVSFALSRGAGYRVRNLAQIRASYQRLIAEAESAQVPVLFCSNHLTYIDSILALWAFQGIGSYLRHPHRFFWNVVAGDVFSKNLFYRCLFLLQKCIFVYRDGSQEHKSETLEKMREVFRMKDSLFVFPEGTRSRTGRFQAQRLKSGAARIALEFPECKLVALYIRSECQTGHSKFPSGGSILSIELQEIDFFDVADVPTLTRLIGEKLSEMEADYFRRFEPELIHTWNAGNETRSASNAIRNATDKNSAI